MSTKLDLKGYKALLFALVTILTAFPVLHDFAYVGIITGLVLIGVLLAAVRAVANRRRQIVICGILGATATIGFFGDLLGSGPGFGLIAKLGYGLFFLYVGIIIMLNIMLQIRQVTADLIYGSINVYLLVGLAFAFLHALIEFIHPGSISGLESLSIEDTTVMPFIYYSFVTMTTLGYGDLSPVTGPAASAAYVEAIFGQLYIAIMIARLMGLYVANESSQGE